jgi:hypothetical protein
MKNKKGFLVFILVFLLCLFQRGFAYADYAHIVDRDTYGALSKEGIDKMSNAISAKDHIEFNKLLIEGEIFPVKKGTRVFLEDISFSQGYVRVRPEGQTRSIWMFTSDLTPEDKAKNAGSPKKSSIDKESAACRIKGFFYDKGHPTIMIGEEVYSLGDAICGGTIVNISSDRVTIKFQDIEKQYKIGNLIQNPDSLRTNAETNKPESRFFGKSVEYEEKLKEYLKNKPLISEDIRECLNKRCVCIGMDKEQAALVEGGGSSQRIIHNGKEVWLIEWYYPGGYTDFDLIYFKDARVVEVSAVDSEENLPSFFKDWRERLLENNQ